MVDKPTFKDLVKERIPSFLYPCARWAWLYFADARDFLLKRRDPLVPPKRKIYIGAGDFKGVGDHAVRMLTDLCYLKPNYHVLDIGCGIGRVAASLTQVMNSQGSYEGFDIVDSGIHWCKKNITPRYPQFRFQLADIFNQFYNPKGRFRGADYRFPYDDNQFDLAFATSVFTHLMPDETERYIFESARVLKPNGHLFMTAYLLNESSRNMRNSKVPEWDFKFDHGTYRIIDEDRPEASVAHEEAFIFSICKRSGLTLVNPIHYGGWSGNPHPLTLQDVLIFKKTE